MIYWMLMQILTVVLMIYLLRYMIKNIAEALKPKYMWSDTVDGETVTWGISILKYLNNEAEILVFAEGDVLRRLEPIHVLIIWETQLRCPDRWITLQRVSETRYEARTTICRGTYQLVALVDGRNRMVAEHRYVVI